MKVHRKYRQKISTPDLLIVTVFLVGCIIIALPHLIYGEEKMSFTITSTVFFDGGEIPAKYTCEGEDLSPPLMWKDMPEGQRVLFLLLMTLTHRIRTTRG